MPGRPRILYVDDDADVAESVATHLGAEREGFGVATATRAEEALERLGEGRVDCVVSAYDLPEADGVAFLRAVRARHPDLPFVLYAASGSEAVASEAIAAGVSDYVVQDAPTGEHAALARRVRNVVERANHDPDSTTGGEAFETVFEAAQDALFLYDVVESDGDPEFRLRRLNPAHEAITGLSAEDLRGATPREIVGDEQGADVAANLRRCLESRESISYEEVLDLPTGSKTWQTRLAPVIRDGEVTQIVGVARDVTEQRERERTLRETSRRLDLALDATDTGVWQWNVETDEVVWSETLERLLGIEPGSFGGTFEAHAEFLHPDDVSTVERAVEDTLEGDGEFQAEYRMEREDGEVIWVESKGRRLEDDEPRRMVGTITDITGRKATEEALARREMLEPSVELEFHSRGLGEAVLAGGGGEFEFSIAGAVSRGDGQYLLYATAEGASPKELRSVFDSVPTLGESRLLRSVGDSTRFEVAARPESVIATFDAFDGELQAFTLKGDTATFVGEFPETVDPAAVTDAVQAVYGDAELVSRRRDVAPAYLRNAIEDDLTERQQTVLRMAYYANYFERPRESTGDELAARLGITRQTFNDHLRKAQSTVFHAVFEQAVDLPT